MAKTTTQVERFGHWLALKQYQFEVTFAINVYTRGEKIFFWSLFALIVGLFSAWFILLVPRSIALTVSRAFLYIVDEAGEVLTSPNSPKAIMSVPEAAVRSSSVFPHL
ncbi:hypothetical protein G7054_g15071 [Neopestalotiopsis clavispora]|nr:hypothetical protein G7054_g15071 [Neopestalotiopsis clavispora]